MNQSASKYVNYLRTRGITDSTIKTFDLGGCDKTGQCTPSECTQLIDFRFRDTVLFPIKDLYNSLVAVGSRSIETKRYLHTKYSKKYHLYGLNVTHEEIIKKREVFVVEGNFDLLTLYDRGVKNVVAMLGSKLSMEQLSLITRFAEKIIIATDGDDAGRESARKMSKMFAENNVLHGYLNLPNRYDPDLLVREYGVDAFLGLQPLSPFEKLRGMSWEKQGT